VVWFGEIPHHMDEIWQHLDAADLFAAIGTSGQVYPAAAFGQEAARAGAHTVQLNLDPADNARDFAEHRHGPASKIVPAWVEEILGA
jgi:NAD-dependent deacetylase